ncbi:FtsX-like permease family protein [Curtobacterium flaccumfaciens]|uniref:FtsX-like permease family protein n=1 Tax=Curtobacterium flaccumfaciens TaxID=2035 RepID=UPI001266E185|nr:FtsX-like permease family protein [Curtobacterium flaccumfaciens]MBT1665610.1 FtsX-like permease family protein [Curtobacterium flaccumfaciens pv. flaccumfaciens]QFS80075.1 FtsX-like permease family protein [Curtobacterium flaccumfaciens pv. flaccumfaciens]
MLRLVLSDLRQNAGIWIGALVVSAATAAAAAIAAGMLETGFAIIGSGGPTDLLRAGGLTTLASLVVVLTIVAVTAVLGSVTRLTIDLQRRGYALWQLVGVPSRTVTAVVRLQLAVVALVGSTIGCLVVAPFVPAFLHFGLSESDGLRDLDERFGPTSAVSVVLAVTVVVVLSSLRPSRRAGLVRPIEVLREPESVRTRTTWTRWAASAVALLLAGLLTSSIVDAGVRTGGQVLLIGPLVTAACTAIGPVVFPATLRAWTAVVPAHRSASWFLARNAAAFSVDRSSATVSALVITIALPGSLFAGFDTLGDAVHRTTGSSSGGGLDVQSVLLMLGGPLLVSLFGAAATVLMAGRTREQEAALVEAAGGSRATVLARAAWESVILVGTAVLVAAVVLVLTACGQAVALAVTVPGTQPQLGLQAALPAALVSLVLMVAAGTIPLVTGRRRSIPLVLAAD